MLHVIDHDIFRLPYGNVNHHPSLDPFLQLRVPFDEFVAGDIELPAEAVHRLPPGYGVSLFFYGRFRFGFRRLYGFLHLRGDGDTNRPPDGERLGAQSGIRLDDIDGRHFVAHGNRVERLFFLNGMESIILCRRRIVRRFHSFLLLRNA